MQNIAGMRGASALRKQGRKDYRLAIRIRPDVTAGLPDYDALWKCISRQVLRSDHDKFISACRGVGWGGGLLDDNCFFARPHALDRMLRHMRHHYKRVYVEAKKDEAFASKVELQLGLALKQLNMSFIKDDPYYRPCELKTK
jgi:hypothetical protein